MDFCFKFSARMWVICIFWGGKKVVIKFLMLKENSSIWITKGVRALTDEYLTATRIVFGILWMDGYTHSRLSFMSWNCRIIVHIINDHRVYVPLTQILLKVSQDHRDWSSLWELLKHGSRLEREREREREREIFIDKKSKNKTYTLFI